MPGLDGYGLLRALQSDPATAGYPVMFLTGNQQFGERVRAFRFGVVDYLTKPFSREALLRKVERVLDARDKRSGRAEVTGSATGALLDEVQRDARTGVFTAKGGGQEVRLVVRVGEVANGAAGPLPSGVGATAQFQELDPRYEDVTSGAASPPSVGGALPAFDEVPEPLRVALLVDDNALFRRFLRDILTDRGFRVLEAADGDEGLRLALERRPGVIVVDARMPGLDGFEVCRRLRQHTLTAHTPVLFLSGWDDHVARATGLQAGADDYLSKETGVRELLGRVRLLMQRYLSPASESPGLPTMAGEVELVGAPNLLQMCHLTRLTGTLRVRRGDEHAEVAFRRGDVVAARTGDVAGMEAVFALLAWERGAFRFTTEEPPAGTPLGENFDQLLLEGARRLDESRRRG
jgi:DNA-binding response OmpR family regulator